MCVVGRLVGELVLCAVHTVPFFHLDIKNEALGRQLYYRSESLLCGFMFVRLYHVYLWQVTIRNLRGRVRACHDCACSGTSSPTWPVQAGTERVPKVLQPGRFVPDQRLQDHQADARVRHLAPHPRLQGEQTSASSRTTHPPTTCMRTPRGYMPYYCCKEFRGSNNTLLPLPADAQYHQHLPHTARVTPRR